MSLYLIIVFLLRFIQVFLMVQFQVLYISSCTLNLYLPLLIRTITHHSFADDLQLQMSALPKIS